MKSSKLDPIKYELLWAHMSQPPNGISIGSAVFARLMNVTNRQTDRQTHTHRPTMLLRM